MSGDTLHVSVVEARNLAAMDSNGKSDPYCVIKSSLNKQTFKTKVCKKTLQPVWNEEFKIFTTKVEGNINIRLWDKDRWTKDDFLGEVTIKTGELSSGKAIDQWYDLVNEPTQPKPTGQLHLRLHFPNNNTLSPASPSSASSTSKQENRKSAPPQTSTPASPTTPTSPAAPAKSPSTSNVPTSNHRGTIQHNQSERLEDYYTFGKVLGKGGFSTVREGTSKKDGTKVAIKLIQKTAFKESDISLVKREISIMKRLNHPNIVHLYDVFDSENELALVLELITGGELFDHIVNVGHFSEADAANLVKQTLSAIAYMHENGIAHRDLKPENLLLGGEKKEIIKITDFGLSNELNPESGVLVTRCGTPHYVAPEVVQGCPYDGAVDLWALGVITYIMLCGYPPFYGKTDNIIFERIMNAEYTFRSPDWDHISDNAKDFIRALLQINPGDRMSAAESLKHAWLTNSAKVAHAKIDTSKLKSFVF